MKKFALLDLFSGIGGFSLGLERSGFFKTVAFCEIEPFPRAVLRKHWPEIPIYEDVRTLTAERLAADGITVDAICGGFPCQDISESNVYGSGLDGERSGLWMEFSRLIGEIRPKFAFVENVSNLLGRGFGRVLGYLASIGYDAEWRCIRASDLGAPHERERVWIVAYPIKTKRGAIDSARGRMARLDAILSGEETTSRFARSSSSTWHQSWPEFVKEAGMLDDGLSRGMDEFNGFANAIVPQIPEIIGRAIGEAQA